MPTDHIPIPSPDSPSEAAGRTPAAPQDAGGYAPVRLRAVLVPLLAVNASVVVLAVASFLIHHRTEGMAAAVSYTVYEFVTLDGEGNVSAWLSALLWALLGLVGAVYAATASRLRGSWLMFAVVCLVASIDEAVSLHERLNMIGDRLLPYLPFTVAYTWTIPGIVVAVVVALTMLRLVRSLPSTARGWLIAAAGVFLVGAVGFELLGAERADAAGFDSVYWRLMVVEETLELAGLALAIASLTTLTQWNDKERALRVVA